MYRFAILLGLAAAAVSPASAKDKDAPAADGAPKEKKICRKEIATGSMMLKSVCKTKAEWDAIAAQSQSDLNRSRNLPGRGMRPDSGG